MKALIFIGEMTFIIIILFFFLFAFVSLLEKEKRAFVRSGFFFLFFVLLDILFLVIPAPAFKGWIFGGIALIILGSISWLFLSPPPGKKIEIVGLQNAIDERDVLFARFDYEEGTQRFEDYYRRHGEYRQIDGEIRKWPDLFSPSHLKKDPVLFSMAAAEFDFLEHLLSLVKGDIFPRKSKLSDEENTRIVKSLVKYLGSELCGIGFLKRPYVYSHTGRGPEPYGQEIKLDHPFAIVFALEMDMTMVAASPKAPVIVETGKQYVEAAKISILMAEFIRRLGYSARAHIAGSNYQAMLSPLGWEAGLGELGRLGILVTGKFGPRARLGLVTTDLPLKPDEPKTFGIQDFCERCQKCARICPAQAIPYGGKEEENGVLKWVLKRERCYGYWRKTGTDCAMCLFVCPYSKPDNLFHRLFRTAVSKSSLLQILSVWGDDLFYGRKPQRKKTPFDWR
jgi:reductive dehalogenase